MSTKTIFVDESTFNKASKKLQNKLKEELPNFSLSKSKELLAESFGFKNYHGLQRFYRKENVEKTKIKLSSKQYIKIADYFDFESSNLFWWSRAKGMFKAVLSYLDKSRNGVYSISDIEYYLKIENLFSIINGDESDEVKSNILNYLSTIPGYTVGDKEASDVLREQHGYLSMQFYKYLDIVKVLEKKGDILLFSLSWLVDRDNNKVTKEYLNTVFEKYAFNAWEKECGKFFPCENKATIFNFKENIYYSNLFKNSWLNDDLFVTHVLLEQFRLKKLEDIYLSDLFVIWEDVINIELMDISKKIIINLLKNIDTVIKISNRFQSLSN